MATQVAVLNMHAKAVSQAAARRKRVAFTNDRDPKLADIVANCKDGEVVQINTDQGEARLSNAAFLAQAKIEAALAGLKIAHAEATEILLDSWPGMGGPVVLGGGGR